MKGKLIFSLVLSVLVVTQVYATSIIANFDGGAGSDTYDQFSGVGGGTGAGGWLTAWTLGGSNYDSTGTGIATSSQLNGGGNYLYTKITGTSSGTGNGYVSRQHDSSVVSLSQSLVYQFDFRIDSFTTTGEIDIFSARVQSGYSSAAYSTWCIVYTGTQFTFRNGTGSNALASSGSFNTGLGTVNTTYHFIITVNPTTGTYVGSISDGTNSVTSGSLTFRAATYNSSSDEGSYLIFQAQDTTASTTDYVAFSVDNISIASIPENSTGMYFVFGALLLAAFYHAKGRKEASCKMILSEI